MNEFGETEVLITGGLGFIGSNLAHKLVKLGANVTVVDALVPEMGGNMYNIHEIRKRIQLNFADIRDEDAINQLVKDKDYMFNLAAQLSHTESMRNPLLDLDINCRGHLILLEACRKFNDGVRIIYTGTRAQYGKILYNPVDEDHPVNPTDANGITKHACEQYHLLYYNVYGIKATSLRLTNTYGPRHQMKHKDQGFVGWFIRQAMDGEGIKIFGDGQQIRDVNYIDDVVDALLMAAMSNKASGEAFNLGGCPTSLLNLVEMVIDAVGSGTYKLVKYPKKWKKIEIGDYIADITKIKKVLGWEPKTGIKEGLIKTVKYYEKNKSYYW
jgi:nucleoside-diphosphate-sugar epimerase